MAERQPKKLNWWYDRLVDWLILNPEKSLGEAAKDFGVTQSWLAIVKNSDAFKAYYKARSAAYSDKLESANIGSVLGVKEKAASAAELALDEINRRLETKCSVMPVKELMDIAKMNLAMQGFAANRNSPPPVNVNIDLSGAVDRSALEAARERMRKVSGAAPTPLLPGSGRPVNKSEAELLPAGGSEGEAAKVVNG